MNKTILFQTLGAIALMVFIVVMARTGHCWTCPSYKCSSGSTCGVSNGCVCIKPPGEYMGNCYHISSVSEEGE